MIKNEYDYVNLKVKFLDMGYDRNFSLLYFNDEEYVFFMNKLLFRKEVWLMDGLKCYNVIFFKIKIIDCNKIGEKESKF